MTPEVINIATYNLCLGIFKSLFDVNRVKYVPTKTTKRYLILLDMT